jgi:hypothetical protein
MMRWTEHLERIRKKRNDYRLLVVKTRGKEATRKAKTEVGA